MRDVFDVLAGDILELMLEACGRVDRELPVHAAPQRIDTAFTPSPGASSRLRTLGIIGWMASGPCAFECFHNAPTVDALREVAMGLVGMRLVVIRELPVNRETLLVRMMGRDQILRRAIAEFDALPADAPERRITAAVVDYGKRTTKEETAMSARTDLLRKRMEDFFRDARERGLSAGMKAGLEEGLRRGIEKGIRVGAASSFEHQFAHRLQRPLTKSERASLRRRVDVLGPERVGAVVLDLPVDALAPWLREPETPAPDPTAAAPSTSRRRPRATR